MPDAVTTLRKGAIVRLGEPFGGKGEIIEWVVSTDLATLVRVYLLRADGSRITTHKGRRYQKAWVPLHEIEEVTE